MTPNPGKVKSVIKIDLGNNRDRTSGDFLALRDKIFSEFELKQEKKTEYFI